MQQSYLVGCPRFSTQVLESIANQISSLSDISAVLVYPPRYTNKESAVFLLVTSDEEMCQEFVELTQSMLRNKKYHQYSAGEVRFRAFCDSWSEFRSWVRKHSDQRLAQQPYVDIMVVTPDWQQRLPHFEQAYFSDTPLFIRGLVEKEPWLTA